MNLPTFKEYLTEEQEFLQILNEKLIVLGGGKKNGQIIFMAGGAGSGKGFAIKNFLQGEKFKIRDVDAWKTGLIELDKNNKLDNEKFRDQLEKEAGVSRLKDLTLKDPNNVGLLHQIVKRLGIKDKSLDLLLTDLKKESLPNILFDITLKEASDISDVVPRLIDIGYEPKNIHLVWVLTDYTVAVQRNKDRERVVPDDIVLETHKGAAKTMIKIINGDAGKIVNSRTLWGDIHVILNNKENTIFFTDKDTKDTIKNRKQSRGEKLDVVKHFVSVQIKKAGRPIFKDSQIKNQLYAWIKNNAPKSKNLFK